MPYRMSRLGFTELNVLDLDDALDFYVNCFGLKLVERAGEQAYLRTWDESLAYSLVLRKADSAGMHRFAFRTVDAEDLDYFEHRLKQHEVKYDTITSEFKRGKTLRFEVAGSGHTMELFWEMEQPGNDLSIENPDPWPRHLKYDAINPTKIDHVVITSPESLKTIRFLEKVLEFRPSEYVMGDDDQPVGAFLRQRQAPHDMLVIPGRARGLHHLGFTIPGPDEIFRAADILSMNKAKIDYGPGRHGATRGTTIYFFDRFGNRLETFGLSSAYQPESDQRPIIWTKGNLGTAMFYYEPRPMESFLGVYT